MSVQEFRAWYERAQHEEPFPLAEYRRRLLAIPEDQRMKAKRSEDFDSHFSPEKETKGARVSSPSGRYWVETSTYATRPGCWGYARAVVYSDKRPEPIADIKRNYDSVPICWIEGHPNGHDYLITGEDYQGQTVVELDTGRQRNTYPDGAVEGIGFCWFGPVGGLVNGHTLLVHGCYWACPDQYKFYDFSDPMNGWRELELPDHVWLSAASSTCILVQTDGQVVWTDGVWIHTATGTPEEESDLDHEDNPEEFHFEVNHTVVLAREGHRMVLVSEEKSPKLLAAEQARAEWSARDKAKRAQLEAECPFLTFIRAEYGVSGCAARNAGGWYPSRHSRDAGDQNYIYFRYYRSPKSEQHQVTFSWGATHGPVTVEYWSRGEGCRTVELERNLDAFVEAWAQAQEYLDQGESS